MNELLQGKATVIKTKEYLSTKEFVQPFIDEISKITTNFKITVKLPDQMTKGDSTDLTYNRVLIEAVLPPSHSVEKHDEVIGFIYGLDVRKPIAKIYRGYLNQACTNLTVFNSKWIQVHELRPGENIPFSLQSLLESPSDFKQRIERLKSDFVDPTTIFKRLGEWVDTTLRESWYNGVQNVRLSPTLPVEGYKSLFVDEDSDYYIPPTKQASMFDVYNAFTQVVTDDSRDFINKFEKTMMINKLLGI